jgi:hypothetical protein
MKSNNRCPERYRNLSPAEECRLRGLRLGTDERPGALPRMESAAAVAAKLEHRRATVLGHMRNGIKTARGLRTAINGGGWIVAVLTDLIADGLVKADRRAGHTVIYEVVV